MTAIPFSALAKTYTEDDALADSLAVAETLELPVTTYVEGDAVLTLVEMLSYWVAKESQLASVAIAGGLLDYAGDDDWLTALALQVYGVERGEETFATTKVAVTNASGGDTFVIAVNDLTFLNSASEKTYKNTSPAAPATVTLGPGDVEVFDVIAEEAGSASSADPGAIDTISSGQLGLTCTNPVAAVGRDREAGEQLKARCRLKVPAISKTAAGPKGKYAYVALTPAENGGANVTRCEVRGNNVDGSVTVVLAGPSGAVSSGDRTLVEAALVDNVIGPTETLTVISATNQGIDITYALWVYDDINVDTVALEAQVSSRLSVLFSLAPIGGWRKTGDVGRVFVNLLEATIKSVTKRAFQVEVTLPASDTALTQNQVPVVGALTGTIHLVETPPSGGTV